MTPPTTPTAEQIKKAKAIIGKWGYEEEYWWKPIATALHSIQSQNIREMMEIVNACVDLCRCADYSCTGVCPEVNDALRSYAKDKGIEIE